MSRITIYGTLIDTLLLLPAPSTDKIKMNRIKEYLFSSNLAIFWRISQLMLWLWEYNMHACMHAHLGAVYISYSEHLMHNTINKWIGIDW